MGRRRNTRKALDFYNGLINQNKQVENTPKEEIVNDDIKISRSFDIKKIDKNKKNLKELLIKTNIDRKRKIEAKKLPDTITNDHDINNASFESLRNGFVTSTKKDKYISKNKEAFKSLRPTEMKKLMKIYLQHIEKK